jgi:hypothetical protein
MLLDSTVLGGRATAGEVAGRAVLLVQLPPPRWNFRRSPPLWELHDVPWDDPDAECTDSYWDGEALIARLNESAIEWLPSSELRSFIDEHFHELESARVMRDRGL